MYPFASRLSLPPKISKIAFQRGGMSRGKSPRSTEEKRSVMPSSSARLRRYSSPSTEKARGGVRVTKLCWSSEGGWREVGRGDTGVTATGDECCVISGHGLKLPFISEV